MQSWLRWAPRAAIALLVALGLVPLWIWWSTDRLHHRVRDAVAPANAALLEAQLAFAAEVSAFRGFELTGDSLLLGRFRHELARERAASRRLDLHVRPLSQEVAGAVDEFQERKDEWRDRPLELLAGRVSRDVLIATLPAGQRQLEAALEAGERVNDAVVREEAALRTRIQLEERVAWFLVALFSASALAVALIVAWLAQRLDELTRELRYRVAEETSLHRLARALSGAGSFEDVARQVAADALRSTRATGAYVERVDGGEVEVIASEGAGVPAPAARVPFERSMTGAAGGAAEPVAVIGCDEIESALPSRPDAGGPERHGMIARLGTDEGALGALVLIAEAADGSFVGSELAYVRALGDLVTAALRRVLLLERERRVRAEAETAVRHRDQVLRVVSHDLKNPLHTVRMVADVLVELPLSEGERAEQLQIIRRAVGRMDALVRDLLDAVRVQAGRALVIVPERLPVAPLLRDAAEPFGVVARAKRQRLDVDVAPGVGDVLGDRGRLLQVFSNLIGNATKFTPEGGRIRVAAEPAGNGAVRFSVADTGPGIPAENLPHLFDPFWQAKDGAVLGTGLGLAIARGIVEGHGGRVAVASEPGEGATFTFELPAAGARTEGGTAERRLARQPGRSSAA